MINFRFHLISLVAVFLALGVGIVIGSTVVDDAIVDRLERDIDRVRSESAERDRENDALRTELELADTYMEASVRYAVEARLAEVPVVVIAERGVDPGVVEDGVATLRAAGAELPGVLWLEERWRLEDLEEVRGLKESTGATGSKVAARAFALEAVATRLAEGPPPPDQEDAAPDVIAALRAVGFLGFDGDEEALGAFPLPPVRAVIVTSTDSRLLDAEVAVTAAEAFADAGVATLVAEAYADEEQPRGVAVAPLRTDEELARRVASVDHLDLAQGRVAAVLALEQLATGAVGHYGYGPDADHPLPPTGT